MNLKIYAVRDDKISAFSQPFYSHTDGSALRAFSDHVNDKQSPVNKHPGDYSLWQLGDFDDQTGAINGNTPRMIGTATEYLNKE